MTSAVTWAATHRIHTADGWRVDVMAPPDGAGPAYSEAEWAAGAAAHYERDAAGDWTFQGRVFAGRVVALETRP